MTLRSILAALAVAASAVAWAADPGAGGGSTAGPTAGAASTTLLPSHPQRARPKPAPAPAPGRVTAARRARGVQARTPAPERAAVARVVPASGVIRRPPEHAAPPSPGDARAGARGGFGLGGFAGYEAANVSGLSCRLDGVLPVLDVGPRVSLGAVLSLGYSRLTDRIGLMSLAADVFKLVPAARFTVPLGTRFSVFADLGFGVAVVSARLASVDPAVVTVTEPSDRSVNAMARVGVGAWFHATRRLALGAMAELDPIFGDFAYAGAAAQSTFLVQGGMMVRL